jgi:hypothetical protein
MGSGAAAGFESAQAAAAKSTPQNAARKRTVWVISGCR